MKEIIVWVLFAAFIREDGTPGHMTPPLVFDKQEACERRLKDAMEDGLVPLDFEGNRVGTIGENGVCVQLRAVMLPPEEDA